MTKPGRFTFESHSVEATLELGRAIGRAARPGDVLALVGPLGAGKTHLVKGLAEGLGIDDSRAVVSPTFVLLREYEGRLSLYHFDAYRLENVREMFDLGCEEYFEGDGVCVVEWADRVPQCLPREYLEVRLEILSPTRRQIQLVGVGSRPAERVHATQASMESGSARTDTGDR